MGALHEQLALIAGGVLAPDPAFALDGRRAGTNELGPAECGIGGSPLFGELEWIAFGAGRDRILVDFVAQTVSGRKLLIDAFGIDTGGNHGAQVHEFARQRRGRRVFACKGVAGSRPVFPLHPIKSNTGHPLYLIGVDTAKETIYSRLKIVPPAPGERRPGFIHFPISDAFGPAYFKQLNSERREVRKRMGQTYAVWVKVVERNEVLDTLVGALAVRKCLGQLRHRLEYTTTAPNPPRPTPAAPPPIRPAPEMTRPPNDEDRHSAFVNQQPPRLARPGFIGARPGWMSKH